MMSITEISVFPPIFIANLHFFLNEELNFNTNIWKLFSILGHKQIFVV